MQYQGYPAANTVDAGAKVSWHGYATKADAEAASKAAKHNALALAANGLGYDTGRNVPGTIEAPSSPDNRLPGLWTVTVPLAPTFAALLPRAR